MGLGGSFQEVALEKTVRCTSQWRTSASLDAAFQSMWSKCSAWSCLHRWIGADCFDP